MSILAIIPARGGSKRLPGKNLRLLGGRPLIAWSIEAAKGLPGLSDILLSTDDSAIAEAGRAAGATVPWLRPAALATDDASSVDVCLHALDWHEANHGSVDGVLLLQPTSPFRRRATLLAGCESFTRHGRRPVIGVSPAATHPMWCFRLSNGGMVPFVDGLGLQSRSQDLPPAFAVNGSFYLVTPADLRSRRSFFADDMLPLVSEDPVENIDIDTPLDWVLAEAAVAHPGFVTGWEA